MMVLQEDTYFRLVAMKNKISELKDIYDLQLLLKTSGKELENQINNPIYYSFEIPKKKGGKRTIQSPNADLLAVQKTLNLYFQAIYLLKKPKEVHGFISRPRGYEFTHSIVSNAAPHVNKKHILNIDLKDFFSSISAARVREILVHDVGIIKEGMLANVITLLCTFQKSLPTGAPTSPVLANLACLAMDRELRAFCAFHQLTFTRYADDLTFSSDTYFESDTIKELRSIIERHCFAINEKKFRLLSSRSRQIVTGIVVNQKLNVDRVYIRNIRATLHDVKTNGPEAAAMKHYKVVSANQLLQRKLLFKIRGQIDFIGHVRGKEDGIYLRLLDSLISK